MTRPHGGWFILALALAALTPAGSVAAQGTLETAVLRNDDGPLAVRARDPDGSWQLPPGDAVLLDETWWTPLRPLEPVAQRPIQPGSDLLERIGGEQLTAWSVGDVTLDGIDDLVVSFRRPFERNFMNVTRPRRAWVDADGLSAHIGLYRPDDLSSIWVAGTLVSPIVAMAACDGGLAVAYGEMDEPGITETGAWSWVMFGFAAAEPLPGPGTPICVDIDGDGRSEPAILGRSG